MCPETTFFLFTQDSLDLLFEVVSHTFNMYCKITVYAHDVMFRMNFPHSGEK